MERWLGRYQAFFFFSLRVMAGLMFALHGAGKVLGWPGGAPPIAVTSFAGFGGLLELVCGVLITIGFLGGTAAFLASGEMAVGYFMFHAKGGFLPTENKGELAVLYCFVFLFMAAHGSGILSVDAALKGNRKGLN